MNKFINKPDGLGALAGCAFWLFAFAAGAAAVFAGLVRLGGLAL
jgi:hypothetical protein